LGKGFKGRKKSLPIKNGGETYTGKGRGGESRNAKRGLSEEHI